MGKRKRMGMNDRVFDVVVLMLVVAVVFCTGIVLGWLDAPKNGVACLPFEGVDFVMYGFEGDRDTRSESEAVLDALAGLEMRRVVHEFVGMVQHPLDIGLYDGWNPVGTVLVVHDDTGWYIQVNDGNRNDCGLYAVPWADVKRVAELLVATD